jgi:hypothetical protein
MVREVGRQGPGQLTSRAHFCRGVGFRKPTSRGNSPRSTTGDVDPPRVSLEHRGDVAMV